MILVRGKPPLSFLIILWYLSVQDLGSFPVSPLSQQPVFQGLSCLRLQTHGLVQPPIGCRALPGLLLFAHLNTGMLTVQEAVRRMNEIYDVEFVADRVSSEFGKAQECRGPVLSLLRSKQRPGNLSPFQDDTASTTSWWAFGS